MENSFEKTPGELANELLLLSDRYCSLTDDLAEVYRVKDVNWHLFRDIVSSDKQADAEWGRTEPGIKEREIDLELKKIKVKISAIRKFLEVKSDEAHSLM